MSKAEIKDSVLRIAIQLAQQGPGYAQEGVVMRQIAKELNIHRDDDIEVQRLVLDAWYDLFTQRKLGWGFNLENPSSPFFHICQTDKV